MNGQEFVQQQVERGLASCGVLDCNAEFRGKLERERKRLVPMQVGRHGQLQEWLVDWDDPKDTHGQVSHLYPLLPVALHGLHQFQFGPRLDDVCLCGGPVAFEAFGVLG